MHYLLIYDLAPDSKARRGLFLKEHIQMALDAQASGDLILGGGLADPADRAVLLFTGDSPAVAETFARTDPYVTQGLVKNWSVHQWNTVFGALATSPLRPG